MSRPHRSSEKDRGRRHRSSSEEDQDPKPSRTGLNTYWIDGAGIRRDVLQRQICHMLGNEAICKPDKYKGVHGYRITAVRPFTTAQLEDLVEISDEYEKELQTHKSKPNRRNAELPYEESRTSQRHGHRSEESQRYDPRSNYPPSYMSMGPADPYPAAASPFGHPAQSGYPPPHGRHSPPSVSGSSAFSSSTSGYGPPRSGNRDRSDYSNAPMRPPDMPGMTNPYANFGDSMDIDPAPMHQLRGDPGYGHRGDPGYAPPPHHSSGYAIEDRQFRGDPYGAYPPMQPPAFGMDPSVPRHIPAGEPPGRMGMPPGYDDYNRGAAAGGYPSGYKQNPIREEKRPLREEKRPRQDQDHYRKR